ncbi:hypothetical protein [Halolamina salifodinae]|uniref:Flagellar motor component MotA n=1 Tax=Halolamina salifodinae TaxID=1202767 RepID=A0A8T4GY92_9EURY|nr:hypothetical protein [Halolamina salifodinae]MBP1987946.1 flagellar motor component MotA [Halolamina salifodinae]
MISRENAVIAVCITLSLVAVYAASAATTLPTWGSIGIVIGVGVLLPTLLNEYLDRQSGEH